METKEGEGGREKESERQRLAEPISKDNSFYYCSSNKALSATQGRGPLNGEVVMAYRERTIFGYYRDI